MNKRLVVFDLDGTLITGNTWEDFNKAMGITQEQDQKLYDAFKCGTITHYEWDIELIRLYNLDQNKHSKEQVLDYLTQYKIKEDAYAALAEINETAHDTLLLTGSFQITADAVGFELGIKDSIATNTCVFDNQGMLVDIESQGDQQHAKVTKLREFCTRRNISLDDCMVIGDGDNDKELFKVAGHSVTFGNSDKLSKELADHTIQSLTELPDLLSQLD